MASSWRTKTSGSGLRITFAEWNTQVQQSRVNLAASTRENGGSVIRSLILPTFGPASLSAIEPGHIRTWVADLVAAGYSPATIRRAYTLLQLALEMAVDDGRLARSPCRRIALPRIALPRIEQSEKRFLGMDEVEHLADTITPRYRVFVLTGAYTGLRPGEMAALRTDRLDLPPAPTSSGGTDQDTRRTPHRELLAVPRRGTHHAPRYVPGRQEPRLHRARRRAARPARLPPPGLVPGGARFGRWPMRPHDLRHTHVALLIAAGEDPYVISQRLGHASIRPTYDIYGHLFEGRDRQAADALEAARARTLADSPRTLCRSEGPSLGL